LMGGVEVVDFLGTKQVRANSLEHG
jgi:hypothetical protein